MEKYRGRSAGIPRSGAEEHLATMTLKDLRLSALVHLDLLSVERPADRPPLPREVPSFYEMPRRSAGADPGRRRGVDGRSITYFIERYGSGWLAMTKPVDYIVWKLMPEEERSTRSGGQRANGRRDDGAPLARFLHSESEQDLSDAGSRSPPHGRGSWRTRGDPHAPWAEEDGERIKRLYDTVTLSSVRMAGSAGGTRVGVPGDSRDDRRRGGVSAATRRGGKRRMIFEYMDRMVMFQDTPEGLTADMGWLKEAERTAGARLLRPLIAPIGTGSPTDGGVPDDPQAFQADAVKLSKCVLYKKNHLTRIGRCDIQ